MDIKTKAFDIAKKNQLIALIRKYGNMVKENDEVLQQYCDEQYETWKDDIETAIKCFQRLIHQHESKVPECKL